MKNPKTLFWLIIFLVIAAIIVDFPKEFTISLSPTIPVINKKISINQKFYGLSNDFFIGPLHIQKDFSFKKGLDLQGGVSITYKAETGNIPQDSVQDALDSTKSVIERRISYLPELQGNVFGASEPLVQTSKTNNESRIIVEIPGISDVGRAINLIGTTAQLSFWQEGASSSAKQKVSTQSAVPVGLDTVLGPNSKETNLTGKDLERASVTFDSNTGNPQVSLVFTSSGAEKFAEITKNNLNKRVAIVLDDQVISAPTVNTPILDGNAVITGGFTSDQAKALSIQLNAGALPIPLSILQQQTIGPTLGEASLQKSLLAAFLGFVIIVIFMTALYGRFGVLASGALFLYTLFVLALFKLIPVTLTLAGIAGFVLSIGMAVDANILIFERMREELRSGKKLPISIELGFTRAWSSIRDSNISTLITSAILYYFGTGPVRGFALTLAIGVLVSMFSAIVVTRTFLRLIYR